VVALLPLKRIAAAAAAAAKLQVRQRQQQQQQKMMTMRAQGMTRSYTIWREHVSER
jgi:hypothetical protein